MVEEDTQENGDGKRSLEVAMSKLKREVEKANRALSFQ